MSQRPSGKIRLSPDLFAVNDQYASTLREDFGVKMVS
jgi:hypothetical protein